jgi:hypothetical protein
MTIDDKIEKLGKKECSLNRIMEYVSLINEKRSDKISLSPFINEYIKIECEREANIFNKKPNIFNKEYKISISQLFERVSID